MHIIFGNVGRLGNHALGERGAVIFVDALEHPLDVGAVVVQHHVGAVDALGLQGHQLAEHAQQVKAVVSLVPLVLHHALQQVVGFFDIGARKGLVGGREAGLGQKGRGAGAGKLDPAMVKVVAVGVHLAAVGHCRGHHKAAGALHLHLVEGAAPFLYIVQHKNIALDGGVMVARYGPAGPNLQHPYRLRTDGLRIGDRMRVFRVNHNLVHGFLLCARMGDSCTNDTTFFEKVKMLGKKSKFLYHLE